VSLNLDTEVGRLVVQIVKIVDVERWSEKGISVHSDQPCHSRDPLPGVRGVRPMNLFSASEAGVSKNWKY
jgi:hypothetical protein